MTVNRAIYTDLDTLFDTRLALATLLSPVDASATPYVSRKRNNFGNLSADIFETYYRARNKNILHLAPITNIIRYIREQYGESILDAPPYEDTTNGLVINLYPYDLTFVEIEHVKELIRSYIPGVPVSTIKVSTANLEPAYLKNLAQVVVKYDLLNWVEYHLASSALVKNPLVDMVGITPLIHAGSDPVSRMSKDIALGMTDILRTLMDITLVDPSYFSIDLTYASENIEEADR